MDHVTPEVSGTRSMRYKSIRCMEHTISISYMYHMTRELSGTWNICHQKYQVNEAYGARSISYLEHVTSKVLNTWCIQHQKYQVTNAFATRIIRFLDQNSTEVTGTLSMKYLKYQVSGASGTCVTKSTSTTEHMSPEVSGTWSM